MTVTPFIYIAGGIVAATTLIMILRARKASDLTHLYWEAIQAENNGEEDRAINLYKDALNRSQKMMTGDKKLRVNIERRLKTLLNSQSFEKGFRQSKGIALSRHNTPYQYNYHSAENHQISAVKATT